MNKLFTKIAALALGAAMVVGVGVAVGSKSKASSAEAEDVSVVKLTFPDDNSENNGVGSYTDTWTATIGSYSWSISNFNNNSWNNSWTYIKTGQKKSACNGTITTSAALSDAITKVTISITSITQANSITLYTSTDGSNWASAGSFTVAVGNQTVTLATATANLYYEIRTSCTTGSTNGGLIFTAIEYFKEKSVDPGKLDSSVSITTTKPLNMTTTSEDVTLQVSKTPSNASITFSSDAESVATVDETTGAVSAVGVGTATITAYFAGDETYNASSDTITVNVTKGVVPLPASGTLVVNSIDNINGGSGYAAYNGTHVTEIEGDSGAEVSWVSSNVMAGGNLQFKSTSGSGLYNTTPITDSTGAACISEAISIVEKSGNTGTYNVYYGTTANPSSRTTLQPGDKYFAIRRSSGTVYLTSFSVKWAIAKEIENSRIVAGTVSANSEDQEWVLDGFKFYVTYKGESETEVTDDTVFTVSPSTVPTITETGTTKVSVTGTFGQESKTASNIDATLTYINPYSIARLYNYDLGLNQYVNNVVFDGIYMGYNTHVSSNTTYYDIFVADGYYGMYVYGSLTSEPSYTVGETYLTVTGKLKNYNYLYEIDTGASVSVLTDATRKNNISAPRTYEVTGLEDGTMLDVANRKTSLSGKVTGIKVGSGSKVTTEGTKATASSNNSVYVTVNNHEVLLYVKSAQATTDVVSKIEVGKSITAEGFSTFFNSSGATFEVLFTSLVQGDEDYSVYDFARDLLDLTKGVCNENYDGITSNASALTTIWNALNTGNYWLKVVANGEDGTFKLAIPDDSVEVPATQQEIMAMSDSDALKAASYRYDYCTAKYSLTNFAGRTLTVSFENGRVALFSNNETTTATVAIIVVSVIGVSALGGFFFLRKRKEI